MKPLPHNDIVERLRLAPDADFYKPSKWFELMRDAADEIERLRDLRAYDADIIKKRDDYSDELEAKLDEAAAFLDGLADDNERHGYATAAAGCRAMAAKLRA